MRLLAGFSVAAAASDPGVFEQVTFRVVKHLAEGRSSDGLRLLPRIALRSTPAVAVEVKRAGQQFFSRSALALNENG